jgi:hypothetical protein
MEHRLKMEMMEKMGQTVMVIMEEILLGVTEAHLMVAAHSLIDVNDRENFLLDIIVASYLTHNVIGYRVGSVYLPKAYQF